MTVNRDPRFRKSTRSQGDSGCVEIARPLSLFRVRDSKNVDGPVLSVDELQGITFLDFVKKG